MADDLHHRHPTLVAQTVHDFLDRVASPAEPVPAGGSVVALTGASSAALLGLVCGVLQRNGVDGVAHLLDRAADLQARLMLLVDEDAEAFRAFLAARRAGADMGDVAGSMSHPPLAIAAACQAIGALSGDVERHASGPMLGDVRAARHLARAASAAALDLAEQDIQLQSDPAARAALRREITRLRSHH